MFEKFYDKEDKKPVGKNNGHALYLNNLIKYKYDLDDVLIDYRETALPYYVKRFWINIKRREAQQFLIKSIKSFLQEVLDTVTDNQAELEITAFLDVQNYISEEIKGNEWR